MAGGSPYLIQNGTRREVVLCRPEHLREFHRGDSKEHWKAPDGNMGYFFHRLLGECVGAQSGSEWTNIRSLFDPIYTTAAMSKYISTFRKEVQLWLDNLPGHGSAGDSDAPFFAANISNKCGVLPLKLVAMTLYGDALSHEVSPADKNQVVSLTDIYKLFEDLLELSKLREEVGSNAFMSMSVISRIYAFLPTKANRQLDKYIAGFRNFNNQIAETAKQLLHTVDEILFENLDVAASALSCLLLNMACDVASQEDVRREARLAVGMLKADATVEAYLDRSDTYLEQCCAESRRLCPSIWFTFCERSPNPKVIDGFEVPANTDVTVDWRRISLESPIWSLSLDEGQREITGYDFVPRRYEHISKADIRYSQVGYGPVAQEIFAMSSIQANAEDSLEGLRHLINASINTIQSDLKAHNDPPLYIASSSRHPLRERHDERVSRALKCVSSAGIMLRALCDPEAWMHDIMFNFADLTALYVACQADIATLIGEEPLDASAIAKKTGIDADKMSRHLRALCNIHIFREVAPDVFQNNELSLLLQSESKRALVGLCAEESRLASCKMWEALTEPGYKDSKASNMAAFNIAYETDLNIFQYWEKLRPDLGERGARAFSGKGFNEKQYLSLYPWAEEADGTLVVDVGGGVGGATLPIVTAFANLILLVQDLPETEAKFIKHLETNHPTVAQTKRASFQAQDFFQVNATKKAPIYFLRHVIHDWPESEAVRLLKNLATAMADSSKILICEHMVLPTYGDGNVCGDSPFIAPTPLLPNWGAGFTSRLDLHVLSCINSKQRTEEDFRALATQAGLAVTSVWRNMGDEVIIECRLVYKNAT
ncbi:Cytochrome P450 [Akanthomyces lecanii RCEF 1005]|uniref:Cytochrome P450 n=1 Tax=Akanthomyces lecanii RCEF 1005 TaxID=1081108 RepID=A0A167S4V6_CORDF|nr:Cytochrome P450 [Akanthomyces lecanii RCEF 1005]